MAKHGKKFLEASKKIDRQKYYTVKEAIDLAKETSTTKFDSTIEVHMKTGLDPRQADQQIRDVVVLPNGLGKTVRVLVFCQGEGVAKAQEGGADYIADSDEWIQKIQQGFADFDVAIATPDMMAKAGRLGRVLVFCQGEGVAKAQEGGADYIADSDEWIQKIQQGFAEIGRAHV